MTAPATTTARKERIPVFDGIRGLCALSVVITHVAFTTIVLPSAMGDPKQGFWSILAAGNDLGIGPFFVMSGLFLYRPWVRKALQAGQPTPHQGKYFLRRAARLLPAVWLLTLFSLLALNHSNLGGVWFFLRPFTLLQVYDFHYYAGLDVAWTVPAEAQFYIALPILAVIAHLLSKLATTPRAKARLLTIPLYALVAVQLVWVAYVHSHYGPFPPQFFYPMGMGGVLAIGMLFAIWTVLSQVSPKDTPKVMTAARNHPNRMWLAMVGVFAISCAKLWDKPGTADWVNAPAAINQSILFMAFAFFSMLPLVVPGGVSRLMKVILGNPVSVYLGRISYGIYLWHFFALYIVLGTGTLFGTTYGGVGFVLGKYGFWELFLPTIGMTVALASVSYWVMERPIINFVARITATKKKTVSSPPAISPGQGDGLPKAA
jgi:peptidoglycan/LPS O-acetylase OafA/YrhL